MLSSLRLAPWFAGGKGAVELGGQSLDKDIGPTDLP